MDQQQPRKSKWRDKGPFYVDGGSRYYDEGCKQQIDGRMMKSLGLDNIDDLLEMKAPNFDQRIKTLGGNVVYIGNYCKYFEEELRKQMAMLKQLSEQVASLQRQLENASSFSR